MNGEASWTGGDRTDADKDTDFDEGTMTDIDPDLNSTDETADEASTDNVGETSVEINVEDLIAEIEAESSEQADGRSSASRKRLDEILEEKRAARELEDFEDLEFS